MIGKTRALTPDDEADWKIWRRFRHAHPELLTPMNILAIDRHFGAQEEETT